ncbi:OLC1v1038389C1 [Oldenlandia corymbosa var. corymbosa]|uniref:Multifunctional fusion protein n=1 Tax=Oldenlandia corymbosa var. corymbosa TaxID=529605 RepID=A0AAV1D0M3_OLDCO|nr:OLC1v1038389C1 [Oldenlandia corymbosa var. corymbosa]
MARLVTLLGLFALLAAATVVCVTDDDVEALSCGYVSSQLNPCVGYITNLANKPSSACCNGVKKVSNGARTKKDLIAVCNCIKAELRKLGKKSNASRIANLPHQCGVSRNFPPIDPHYNCARWKIMGKFIVEIEEAKEIEVQKGDGKTRECYSRGPVYRSSLAKDGFKPLAPGLDCCWDIFFKSAKDYAGNRMLGEREMVNGKAGKYVWMTYKEVFDLVSKVGNSIRSCGVTPGDKCGIYGANCTKWVVSMQACNAHGLYCVPLYDTLGAGAIEYIICHAEVSIAFVEETKVSEVLKTFPSSGKYLKTVVSFGRVSREQQEVSMNFGLKIFSWDEFLLLGQGQQFDLPAKKKTDICTIMYTSGTTGDPKGVMISNEAILSIISGVDHQLESISEEFSEKDVYLSYLPLAHIFDRVVEELLINRGASIGFWHKDVKQLLDDIKELKPTVFCSVPRVLDRIYSGLTEKVSSSGLLKSTLFNVAYSYKLRNMSKGYKHSEAAPRLDKIIFSKVKEGLGGNIRLILSGAAPLSSTVETYLRVVTCAHVVQGYGLTETCAGSFVARPDELSMVGTVGPPLPIVDVCLESVPEMGYDALASTPRGEICIRGKCLFSGYYKREDLTKEVMVDGWFHTGDIGEWQPDGSMKIIDRKKNIFKLSQGEYVAVENLENIYGLATCIDSIWVYGSSYESFLVAVVNPNAEVLESWAEENGITAETFDALCENPMAKDYILKELTKIGKEKQLKGFEFIKAVHLDATPFDMERDLLTPTYKKKRAPFLKHYKHMVEELYKSAR